MLLGEMFDMNFQQNNQRHPNNADVFQKYTSFKSALEQICKNKIETQTTKMGTDWIPIIQRTDEITLSTATANGVCNVCENDQIDQEMTMTDLMVNFNANICNQCACINGKHYQANSLHEKIKTIARTYSMAVPSIQRATTRTTMECVLENSDYLLKGIILYIVKNRSTYPTRSVLQR